MALLNYTTRISAAKTASEIQELLAAHGAKVIMIEYGDSGVAEALSFNVMRGKETIAFRLPTDPRAVLKVLERQYDAGKLRSHQSRPMYEQAVMVAWRIVKDWVEAQMAFLETELHDAIRSSIRAKF